jgi:hypothetical protein
MQILDKAAHMVRKALALSYAEPLFIVVRL